MLKNKIAVKLSLYFLVAILTFSVITGIGFTFLFERYVIQFHRDHLADHAIALAQNLSKYIDLRSDVAVYDEFINFALDISINNLWIADEHDHILTNCAGERHEYAFTDLNEMQQSFIRKVMDGETVAENIFEDLIPDAMMSVGTPVINNLGEVVGAVILHSTVDEERITVGHTRAPLLISIGVSLFITSLLSVFLSRRFTAPIISKEVEDAMRLEHTRREFIANISHELRTPVAVIRASLETLIKKLINTPEQIDEYYRQMLKETVFLGRLVNDLLDLAKLQNLDFEIKKEEVIVSDVISDASRSLRQIAKERSVTVDVDVENYDCVIQGDYDRIRQMLINVLDNAIKFSHENGKVTITLKNKTLTVQDNGIGISPEDLLHIFDKFYKEPSEKNKTGTGLGLVIAKQIADRHNIEINVKSIVNSGTTFMFYL
jgi:signal transduction histidine kinase